MNHHHQSIQFLLTGIIYLFTIYSDLTKNYVLSTTSCPPRTRYSYPNFTREMMQSVVVDLFHPQILYCCMDGYETMKWSFSVNGTNWIEIKDNGNFLITQDGRALHIKSAVIENDGIFSCTGKGTGGNSLTGKTIFKVYCSSSGHTLDVTGQEVNPIQQGNPMRICCKMVGLEQPLTQISLFWRHKGYFNDNWTYPIDLTVSHEKFPNSTITCDTNLTVLDEEKKCSTKKIQINTCLNQKRSSLKDMGEYICMFTHFTSKPSVFKYTIKIYFIPPHLFIYLIIGLSISLIVMTTSNIIWLFFYDLKLLISQSKRNSSTLTHRPKVALFYSDKDEQALESIMLISHDLESRGCHTFVIDRDKSFGSTILDTIKLAISESNLSVFYFSCQSFQDEDFIAALTIAITPSSSSTSVSRDYVNVNRCLYIVYPSLSLLKLADTKTKKLLNLYGVSNQISSISPFVWKWVSSIHYHKLFRRRMILWILSNIRPLTHKSTSVLSEIKEA